MKIRSLLVIAVLATAILCSAGAVNAQTPTVQGLMNQIAQLQAQLSSQPAGSVGNLMLQIQILQLQLQLLQLQSATPTRPSISIVSPVANAQLMQGQTYNISWTSSGINTMSINILNQGTAGNWASIVENIPASSGSYSWTVPSAMTPGNYAIYFSDNDSGYTNIPNTIAGYTNLSFNNGSISVIAATPNQPSITVTSPASGVQWAQGSTQNIAWTSTGASASDTIYIKLINDAGNSQNGNNVYSITPAGTTISPSLGSYNWTIPSSLALGSQYYIAIYDSNPSVASRSSNHFSIVAATPTTWCHTFVQYLQLGSKDGVGEATEVGFLKTALTNSGFDVSADAPSTFGRATRSALVAFQIKYKIWPTGTTGPQTRTKLNSLYGCPVSAQPTITSLGTSNALPGEKVAAYVSNLPANPSSYTYGILFSGQTTGGDVNATLSSDGTYLGFTVPNFPTGNYNINVFVFGLGLNSNSVPFTIGSASTQPLTVTSPNGGETLTIGQTYNITWNKGNYPNVNVVIGIQDPKFYQGYVGITQAIPNTGSYQWTVALPIILTGPAFQPDNNYRISIGSAYNVNNYYESDVSDAPFTIVAASTTPLTCSDLQSAPASASYFGGCKNQNFAKVCFNKYNYVYQGCGKSYFNDCTVNNTNASQNIWCDTGLSPNTITASSDTIIGNQSTYSAGQTINFSVKGTVSDILNATQPAVGFNAQAYICKNGDCNNYLQPNPAPSYNGNYNVSTGNWDFSMVAPTDATAAYTIKYSFYCSNASLGCSLGEIDKTFAFSIAGNTQPTITSVNPIAGAGGNKVVITGTNLNASGNTIQFFQNGSLVGSQYPATLDTTSVDGTQLQFTLKPGVVAANTLPYQLRVSNSNGVSNFINFTILATQSGPFINSVSPNSGGNGTYTISGGNFTSSNNITTVEFYQNGVAAAGIGAPSVSVSSDGSQLQFTIAGAFMGMVNPGQYQILVRNSNGASNMVNFTLTNTPAQATLSMPTLVASSTTPSQYIAVGSSGLANASQATYNFVATGGSATITELKFSTINNAVTNVCIPPSSGTQICAAPVAGVADLTGLNITVPMGGGLSQSVFMSYAGVGIGGLQSGTTSVVSLFYVKYVSAGTTNTLAPNINAPTITLVGSAPIVSINQATPATNLILGAQNQIGQVTVAASAQGAIRLNKITFDVSGSGFASGLAIINPSLQFNGVVMPGASFTISGSVVACTLGNSFATDYVLSPGTTATFNLFANVNGVPSSGANPSVSTTLDPAQFIWDDSSTNGASGVSLTGLLINLFPTNSYTIAQSSTPPSNTPYISSITASPVNGFNVISLTGTGIDPLKLVASKIDGLQNLSSSGTGAGCGAPTSANGTSATCSLNKDLTAGTHTFQLFTQDGFSSNIVSFTTNSAWVKPKITSVSPSTVGIGSQITITGSGFDPSNNIIQIEGGGYYGPMTGGYSQLVSSSNNGTIITYTIPSSLSTCTSLPGGTTCPNPPIMKNLQAGSYTVSVVNVNASSYGIEDQGSLTITPTITQPTITVTSPNGGETWQIGVVNSASVSYKNSNANGTMWVYLQKYDSNGNSTNSYLLGTTTLAAANSSGTIYYNISQDVINSMGGAGSNFKVRIWSDAAGNPQDTSDNYFSIVAAPAACTPGQTVSCMPPAGGTQTCVNGQWGACVVSPTPTITVTSPNGGETLTTGQTYTITWNSSNIPSTQNVKIELAYNQNDPTYPGGTRIEDWIVGSTPNTGSYAWTVPEFYGVGIQPSFFQVKISYGSGVVDYSNANFTINMGTSNPALTVSGPIAGHNYNIGDKVPVAWTPYDNTASDFLILLRKSDTSFARWTTLYPVYNSSSAIVSYYWNVIPGLLGNDYYLMVGQSKDATRANIGYSAVFGITNVSTQPSITVTSPNGGESWTQGSPQTIRWTSTNVPTSNNVLVRLQDNSGIEYYIYGNSDISNTVPNNGFFSITVPSTLAPGQYKVEVKTVVNGQSYLDYSDNYFSIVAPTACTKEASCGNNTCGSAGSSCGTTFQCGTCDSFSTCTSVKNNDGTSNYKCVSNTQPSITLTSPASGVQWAQGSTQNITWTSTGASASDTIYIKLINDAGNSQNGNNVYSITPAGTTISPSLGSYNWTIPSSLALGSQYYIAIYDSNPSVASRSSNHFSIVAATPQHLITVSAVNPTYLVSIPIPATWQMNYSSSSMFVSLYDSVANTNMFVSRPLAGAVGSNSYTIQLASNAAPGQYMLYVCDGAPASNGSGSNASSANPTLCGSTGPIAITSVAPVPPVAYYPFEGNANDASGNGNNGTATGAVLTPGETGQAYIFNGKNNYIDVPSASSLEPSSGVSVSAWIKTSGTNAYSGIVEKMRLTGGSQTAGYLLSISNKNTAAFYIGNGKGYSQATGKTNLAQNKWMFVTGTWDASTKKISIYVNGVLDGTGSYSSISYNAGDMTIGWDKYAANRHFNGSIDEVKVWSRVLSPSDVLNEYNSSGPTGLNTLQNNLASITDALNAIEQEIQSLMNR